MSKLIALTRGYSAIVDDEDYLWLRRWKWHVQVYNKTLVYAVRKAGNLKMGMHRQILGIDECPPYVDHINHNGLDNRRDNLRICTNSQNQANGRKCRGTSVYRGVHFYSAKKVWKSQITVSGKLVFLGHFNCEKTAAIAYDVAARKYFGEFANPNFPEGYK